MKIIKNGNLFDVEENVVLNEYDILIKEGKIAKIGKHIDVDDDCEIIDATDKFVLPGLIDCHCHVGIFEEGIGEQGNDVNEVSDPITPHLRGIDAINPMDDGFQRAYEAGITTVGTGPGSANVLGGTFVCMSTFGKRTDDMIIKQEIGMKCAFGENPRRVYGSQKKAPITRMEIAGLLRDTLYKARDYYNKKKNNEKIDFNLKYESLIPVFEKKIPLKAHAHRADDMFTAIRIAKEFGLNISLDHATESHLIVDELVTEQLPIIAGPFMTTKSKYETRHRSLKNVKKLIDAGLQVAIMTDHPVIPINQLITTVALLNKYGVNEFEALKTITITPAQIMGLDHLIGSLKEGKQADIAIYDNHPFAYDANVEYTLIKGERIFTK